MKSQICYHFLSFLIMVFIISGCGQFPGEKDSRYYIVDVTGAAMVLNYSKSNHDFGPIQLNEKDTLTIAVSEGDMLYVLLNDMDEVLFYRYDPDDGLNLSFSFDTVNYVYSLNNDIISLDLSEESKAWGWIKQNEGEVFSNLRSLIISLPVSESEISSLKKITAVNSNPGLYITGDSLVQEVLSLFSPEWLFAEDAGDCIFTEETKPNLEGLELLLFTCTDTTSLEFLYDLRGLKSLIIADCDSFAMVEFQFEKLEKLSSLCLIESNIHDLSSIGMLPELKDLNFVECEDLEEIGPLADFTGLKSIGFRGCENIKGVSVINELPSLMRLSLPVNTSQEEFSGILEAQPSLQVLELIGCENITDLSPLEEYSGLKALMLSTDTAGLTPLYQMTELELLILGEDNYKDSLLIEELKNALPDTKIVPGGTFCLGSGWLLLIIPMIAFFVVLRTRHKKSAIDRTGR